jgi:hypothetical protein
MKTIVNELQSLSFKEEARKKNHFGIGLTS